MNKIPKELGGSNLNALQARRKVPNRQERPSLLKYTKKKGESGYGQKGNKHIIRKGGNQAWYDI